ncbi:MAG: ATP-binding protein [Anaerolineae bacterium]
MAEQNALPDMLDMDAHRLNQRQLSEETLHSLYVATCLAGLGLVALGAQFASAVGAHWAGYPLFLLTYPAYRLLRERYLACAWLLVATWLATTLLVIITLPLAPALSLLVVPVALATLLISTPAGVVTGLLVTAAVLVLTWGSAAPLAAANGAMALTLVWAMLGILWLSLRPMREMVLWSWKRHEQSRGAVEQLRDAQADLKQAIRDIAEASAETIRLNQLLGAARRVAEEAERTKAEFVANVSHELRTPLNMIIGFTDMIMRSPAVYGKDIPPALLADLAVIHRNSEHLSSLIDDVLDLSQVEAGRMALTRERVALQEIVEGAVVAVRPLFESKGLYLTMEVPASLPELFCDRTRIREVVLNLLSNAGRFTDQGGVLVRAWQQAAEVVVSIADTGPGIAAADQERLFRPFEQLDSSTRRRWGGTGLGLTISKRFIELHGGSMWLESEVGKGTTFYFRLPTDTQTREPGARRWLNPEWEYRQRTRRPTAPMVSTRPRLLVVEQDGTLQRLLGRYLGNVDLVGARDLQEALQAMTDTLFHGIVCNVTSVPQALQDVTDPALPEGVPAIVCSVPSIGMSAADLGAHEYLIKPVTYERLLGALTRLGVQRGTVLIVDDEPEARRLFWRMLASAGGHYEVLTASTGREALDVLARDRPDAILVDLVMPDMDGFRLLETLSHSPQLATIPTVVVSARDPLGQPIVSSAFALTRKGGLALHELLACIEAAGRITAAGWGSA